MSILAQQGFPKPPKKACATRRWLSGCGWLWSHLHKPLLETTDYFDLSFELKESGSKPVCAIAATTTAVTLGGSNNE